MEDRAVEYAVVCEPSGRLQRLAIGVEPGTQPEGPEHAQCTGHLVTFRPVGVETATVETATVETATVESATVEAGVEAG